jgi:hypothetical protein
VENRPVPHYAPGVRVRIRKWYLDCSTPDGAAAVVYLGRVSVGALSAPYAEVLARGLGPADIHKKRFSASPTVFELSDRVAVEAPAIGVSGEWLRRAPEFGATLIDDPALRIEWRCQLPQADASLRLPGGHTMTGVGYAEHLLFEGTTAGLPFHHLRWGRFIAADRHVIWIDWSLGLTRRWVFVNGRAVEATTVGRETIAWPGGRLDIDAGVTLRDALIADTIGGRFGRWLPRQLASATETKWSAPARLTEGAATITGHVIHEVVRWP